MPGGGKRRKKRFREFVLGLESRGRKGSPSEIQGQSSLLQRGECHSGREKTFRGAQERETNHALIDGKNLIKGGKESLPVA